MIQYYQVLKLKSDYCRFTTDDDRFIAYLFKDTIQVVDIEKTSDFEFSRLVFQIPVITDLALFKKSEKKEGFNIKPVLLSSIRAFDWLDESKIY
ncbi:MAG: hypothetical protein WC044_11895 [Crocinitomicaceae bacterium]